MSKANGVAVPAAKLAARWEKIAAAPPPAAVPYQAGNQFALR